MKLDSVLMCLCVYGKKLNFLSWAIRPVFADPVTYRQQSPYALNLWLWLQLSSLPKLLLDIVWILSGYCLLLTLLLWCMALWLQWDRNEFLRVLFDEMSAWEISERFLLNSLAVNSNKIICWLGELTWRMAYCLATEYLKGEARVCLNTWEDVEQVSCISV